MLWKKPANMKYVDMCIWIDAVVPKIAANPGEFPKDEDLVYNYLWLLVKAMAIKKRMFQSFSDYDGYAFHSAKRLYFALIKNWNNQGKTIKGKVIRPITSCLNYTKKLLFPMKLEYQNDSFNKIISENFVSKRFDAFSYSEQLKASAKYSLEAVNHCKRYVEDVVNRSSLVLDKVLSSVPFKKGSAEYQNLKTTIWINSYRVLKIRGKLDRIPSNMTIIMWQLPRSLSSYVTSLIGEFFYELKLALLDCFDDLRVNDRILEKMISNPEGLYEEDSYKD